MERDEYDVQAFDHLASPPSPFVCGDGMQDCNENGRSSTSTVSPRQDFEVDQNQEELAPDLPLGVGEEDGEDHDDYDPLFFRQLIREQEEEDYEDGAGRIGNVVPFLIVDSEDSDCEENEQSKDEENSAQKDASNYEKNDGEDDGVQVFANHLNILNRLREQKQLLNGCESVDVEMMDQVQETNAMIEEIQNDLIVRMFRFRERAFFAIEQW